MLVKAKGRNFKRSIGPPLMVLYRVGAAVELPERNTRLGTRKYETQFVTYIHTYGNGKSARNGASTCDHSHVHRLAGWTLQEPVYMSHSSQKCVFLLVFHHVEYFSFTV